MRSILSFPLAALLILIVGSCFAVVVPSNIVLTVSDIPICVACEEFKDAPQARMLAMVDDNARNVEVNLYYEDLGGSPSRKPIGDAVIIIEVSRVETPTKWLFKTYTDAEGKALFSFEGSEFAPEYDGECITIKTLYCPFCGPDQPECGFAECLKYSSIDSAAGTYTNFVEEVTNWDIIPTASDAPPQPTINTGKYLPELGLASFCPPPPPSNLPPAMCLPLLIIFSLLSGALYMSGRNPFTGLNLGNPRAGSHLRYQARGRGVGISASAIASAGISIGQTAKSAKGEGGLAAAELSAAKGRVLGGSLMGGKLGSGKVGKGIEAAKATGNIKDPKARAAAMANIMKGGGGTTAQTDRGKTGQVPTSAVRGSDLAGKNVGQTIGRILLFVVSLTVAGRLIDGYMSLGATNKGLFETVFNGRSEKREEAMKGIADMTKVDAKGGVGTPVTLADGSTAVISKVEPQKDGTTKVTLSPQEGANVKGNITLTVDTKGTVTGEKGTVIGMAFTMIDPKTQQEKNVSITQGTGGQMTVTVTYPATDKDGRVMVDKSGDIPTDKTGKPVLVTETAQISAGKDGSQTVTVTTTRPATDSTGQIITDPKSNEPQVTTEKMQVTTDKNGRETMSVSVTGVDGKSVTLDPVKDKDQIAQVRAQADNMRETASNTAMLAAPEAMGLGKNIKDTVEQANLQMSAISSLASTAGIEGGKDLIDIKKEVESALKDSKATAEVDKVKTEVATRELSLAGQPAEGKGKPEETVVKVHEATEDTKLAKPGFAADLVTDSKIPDDKLVTVKGHAEPGSAPGAPVTEHAESAQQVATKALGSVISEHSPEELKTMSQKDLAGKMVETLAGMGVKPEDAKTILAGMDFKAATGEVNKAGAETVTQLQKAGLGDFAKVDTSQVNRVAAVGNTIHEGNAADILLLDPKAAYENKNLTPEVKYLLAEKEHTENAMKAANHIVGAIEGGNVEAAALWGQRAVGENAHSRDDKIAAQSESPRMERAVAAEQDPKLSDAQNSAQKLSLDGVIKVAEASRKEQALYDSTGSPPVPLDSPWLATRDVKMDVSEVRNLIADGNREGAAKEARGKADEYVILGQPELAKAWDKVADGLEKPADKFNISEPWQALKKIDADAPKFEAREGFKETQNVYAQSLAHDDVNTAERVSGLVKGGDDRTAAAACAERADFYRSMGNTDAANTFEEAAVKLHGQAGSKLSEDKRIALGEELKKDLTMGDELGLTAGQTITDAQKTAAAGKASLEKATNILVDIQQKIAQSKKGESGSA